MSYLSNYKLNETWKIFILTNTAFFFSWSRLQISKIWISSGPVYYELSIFNLVVFTILLIVIFHLKMILDIIKDDVTSSFCIELVPAIWYLCLFVSSVIWLPGMTKGVNSTISEICTHFDIVRTKEHYTAKYF